MKINTISVKPTFKAQLSPEVKSGFLDILEHTDENTKAGKKVVKDMDSILRLTPHISLSTKIYDLRGDIYWGYSMTNSKTGHSVGISNLERSQRDLFTPEHIADIKDTLNEEGIKEFLKKYKKEETSKPVEKKNRLFKIF